MNIFNITPETSISRPCVATIGFFDGVHRGHQSLISHVVREAERSGLESTVITFDEHPRRVLHSEYQPQMLSTLSEKTLLLSRLDIDNCAILHFDARMAQMTAREFMQKVLKERLNVQKLVIGYDNRFGHNRSEGFNEYREYGREMGIEVLHDEPLLIDRGQVSSSEVRRALTAGDIERANKLLGYPYTIIGRVVKGYHEGRRLGFPTANLDTSEYGQMIPEGGVYAVFARTEHSLSERPSMMNIGTRPTFGGRKTTLEVNIFGFEGDLYGQRLMISFVKRIREERKFSSPEELQTQLEVDKTEIENLFETIYSNE